MPAKNKNSYVGEELLWLTRKAEELKLYVEMHPFNTLIDRIATLSSPTGDKEVVVATIEVQQKANILAMKEYAQIIEIIDRLREKEESKKEARGGKDIPYAMRNI